MEVEPVVRQAEMIVAIAEQRWALERRQRRVIASGVLLIVSGVLTVLGGIFTAPSVQSVIYLCIGIFDGIMLYTVATTFWANRQLLKRVGRVRR